MGNTESGTEAPRQPAPGFAPGLSFGFDETVVDELAARKRARLAAGVRRPAFAPRHAQQNNEEAHVPQGQPDREEPVTDVYDNKHHRLNESRVDDLMAGTMHDAVNNLEAHPEHPDRTRSVRYRQPAATNTEVPPETIQGTKSAILNKIEKQREEKVKQMEENMKQLQEQEERQASAITNLVDQFNKNNASRPSTQEQAAVCEKEQIAMTKCYSENKNDLTQCDSYIRAFNDCAVKARLSKLKL